MLITSVYENDVNVHQYIEFSSCLVKKGIWFCQAKRFCRITSNDDCFKLNLERLKTYFQKRNYPIDILSEAVQKASNLTFDEALNTKTTDSQDIIPSLPNIGKIINQYWGLLNPFPHNDTF